MVEIKIEIQTTDGKTNVRTEHFGCDAADESECQAAEEFLRVIAETIGSMAADKFRARRIVLSAMGGGAEMEAKPAAEQS